MFKRKTSISEFERDKPHKTYKLIHGVIYKYEKLMDDNKDHPTVEVYTQIVQDLKLIQKSFLSGE